MLWVGVLAAQSYNAQISAGGVRQGAALELLILIVCGLISHWIQLGVEHYTLWGLECRISQKDNHPFT